MFAAYYINLHFNLCSLLLMLIAACGMHSWASSAEPYSYKSRNCEYRIVVVPNVAEEWELTNDLKYGISLSAGRFEVVSVSDDRILEKSIPAASREWKVVGSELIVGNDDGWDVYSIPNLEILRTIPAPPDWQPHSNRNPIAVSVPLALARGWYCRGLVYDDRVEKIWASFRTLSQRSRVDSSPEGTVLEGIGQIVQQRFLRTDPSSIFPFRFNSDANTLVIPEFDRIPINGLDGQIAGGYRFGCHWLTATGTGNVNGKSTTFGLYVEFLNQDYLNWEFGHSKLSTTNNLSIGLRMPFVSIDENFDTSKWEYELWPSGQKRKLRVNIRPSKYDEAQSDGPTYSNHLLIQKLRDGNLEEYLELAKPEYERIVGRTTDAIPIPFLVEVEFQAETPLFHVVWGEASQVDLEKRFNAKGWQQRLEKTRHENLKAAEAEEKSKSVTLVAFWYLVISSSMFLGSAICTAIVIYSRAKDQRRSRRKQSSTSSEFDSENSGTTPE